jgi:hypothetical protein
LMNKSLVLPASLHRLPRNYSALDYFLTTSTFSVATTSLTSLSGTS